MSMNETVGDAAEMREALVYASEVLSSWRRDAPLKAWAEYDEAISRARAALAKPPRQCDVGTADEQQSRHCAWCRKHGIDGDNAVDCIHPDLYCDLCALRWAQMPYEEKGENNGSK